MNILFSVQRYGLDIAGGAEQHCRWLAEEMAKRGHICTVLTSCAIDYMTWKDEYTPGESFINGVKVVRFPVERQRDIDFFNRIAEQMDFKNHTTPISLEDLWLREQGPALVGASRWLRENRHLFDVAVPFTYLYRTSQLVVSSLHGLLPIVMHATAHDEFPIHLRRINEMLCKVDSFLCSTPEESDLLVQKMTEPPTTDVVGIGVSLAEPGDIAETLARLNIPENSYFVILGRIDPSKGTDRAAQMFNVWRETTQRNVSLVAIGGRSSEFLDLDLGPHVYSTGFVDEQTKSTLLSGALALIQPSPYESFSLALCEAWLAGIPTIATSASDVLRGQTERSQGGLLYFDDTEFSNALHSLVSDEDVRRRLGEAGRQYVSANFQSDHVVSVIEKVLEREIRRFSHR